MPQLTNRVYIGTRLPEPDRDNDQASTTAVFVLQTFDDRGTLRAETPHFLDHICTHDNGRARAFTRKYGCHSPSGFNWGYSGSGPAELALMILLDQGLIDQAAWDLHQAFKSAFIAPIQTDTWQLSEHTIKGWLKLTAQGRRMLRHAATEVIDDSFESNGHNYVSAPPALPPA